VPDQFTERLEMFSNGEGEQQEALLALQRGIEKECLRIDPEGKLAQTPHPEGLGSPLTHPNITTDFSESLLELITPVSTSIEQTLDTLDQVHRAVYPQLAGEELWPASMPCVLGGGEKIPVAKYGTSNIAQMKTAYRRGLGHRYGRPMQTIAGIHYNFSLPESMWALLQQQDHDKRPVKDYKTDAYFSLIRNFRRTSWLLIYLYGASPAVCESFLKGRQHNLERFDRGSFYLPHGTALRMGGLGYQSSAQESLNICYNSIDTYVDTLRCAITNTHPDYQQLGVKKNGEYQQLSASLLQIENEFYSPIRPKRVTQSSEIPIGALASRGVEYIEVRCIDVNPYLPLGIDADQIRFLDCFLLYCLFKRSPLCDDSDRQLINHNQKQIVNCGRAPDLMLATPQGERSMQQWGAELLDGIDKVATLLDNAQGGGDYQRVCAAQRDKLLDPSLTPSAQILADMQEQDTPFFGFAMNLAQQHGQHFRDQPLDPSQQAHFAQLKKNSVEQQRLAEAGDEQTFDEYLASYYRQYSTL
jgi:glutamate--cysteine ligase